MRWHVKRYCAILDMSQEVKSRHLRIILPAEISLKVEDEDGLWTTWDLNRKGRGSATGAVSVN